MKILLEVKDEKASSLMEVLKGLSFVKTKTLTESKAKFLCDLKEAVDEVKFIKSGKLKAKPLQDLLDEL